jgi:hypothetical protein
MHVRATPAVWQINLASIQFWQNEKNCPPTVWQTNLAKLTSPHAYMRARIVLPSAFPSRWEGEKRNKE